MLCKIRSWFYSLFLINVRFIGKRSTDDFHLVPAFSFIELLTNDGKKITFTFKMDNRNRFRACCTKYIVEAEVDGSFSPELQRLNNKVLISVTILMVKSHYRTFANILLHKYLEHAYIYLNKDNKD